MTHYDRSYKDNKYFIDDSVYNCPFCNRRNIKYHITDHGHYDHSNTKIYYYYLVHCKDCCKVSLHLSKYDLKITGRHEEDKFRFPPKKLCKSRAINGSQIESEEDILDQGNKITELDKLFFYHDPTAFFTIDDRIPNSIREPLSEADNCLKSNFLTGASGSLRKAAYKLLQYEKIPEMNTDNKIFLDHDTRVNRLKEKYPAIDAELFDELKAIHTLTSQELHENDWEDFDAPTLHFLLEVIREVLTKIYVTPDETKKRRENLSELKNKAKPPKAIVKALEDVDITPVSTAS